MKFLGASKINMKIFLLICLIGSFFVISESFAQEEWNSYRIVGDFYLPNEKTDYQIQEIPYMIQNGTINEIESKRSSNNILISIDPTENGVLEIKIPRNIIDSTIGDQKDEFFVLRDGKEIDFEEKELYQMDFLCYRNLEILFSKDSSLIEIIGVTALGF